MRPACSLLGIDLWACLSPVFATDCVVCAEWFFTFGYVMAGSRNSWQQTIDAAPPEEMLPAEALSGNVVFETSFFDGDLFLCKNSVRLYYV